MKKSIINVYFSDGSSAVSSGGIGVVAFFSAANLAAVDVILRGM